MFLCECVRYFHVYFRKSCTVCAGIACHLNRNDRHRAKRPRTLALASFLLSVSSLQDSRDFSSPRKDLVLWRDGEIGTQHGAADNEHSAFGRP